MGSYTLDFPFLISQNLIKIIIKRKSRLVPNKNFKGSDLATKSCFNDFSSIKNNTSVQKQLKSKNIVRSVTVDNSFCFAYK